MIMSEKFLQEKNLEHSTIPGDPKASEAFVTTRLKRMMIDKAEHLYGEIYPCTGKTSLWDCFTVEDRKVVLWFNTSDNTTHNVSENLWN